MTYKHEKMASGTWNKFNLMEQLANVGTEVGRAINWREKNAKYSNSAFDRALELLELTINDPKNRGRLKELTRLREVLIDYFVFDNEYGSSDTLWQSYFYPFNYAARINH